MYPYSSVDDIPESVYDYVDAWFDNSAASSAASAASAPSAPRMAAPCSPNRFVRPVRLAPFRWWFLLDPEPAPALVSRWRWVSPLFWLRCAFGSPRVGWRGGRIWRAARRHSRRVLRAVAAVLFVLFWPWLVAFLLG